LKSNEEKLLWEYFDVFTSKMITIDEFFALDAKFLKRILARDTLTIKEIELFEAVVKWGKTQMKQEDPKPEELATALSDILPLIRFPTMSMTDVAAKVAASGLIDSDQILKLYTFMGTKEEQRDSIKVPWKHKPRVGRRPPNWFSWDPSKKGTNITLSNENMVASMGTASWQTVIGDIELSSGVHEFEIVLDQYDTTNSYNVVVGVVPSGTDGSLSNPLGYTGNQGFGFITGNGQKCNNSYPSYYGTACYQGAVIKTRLDLDNHTIEWFVNDASAGVAYTNVYGPVRPALSLIQNQRVTLRFPSAK